MAGGEPALVDQAGGAVAPGPEHAVGGAGHPARVGRTPVDVLVVKVQDVPGGGVVAHDGHVDVGGTLRLAGGAGGVVHDREVLRVRALYLERVRLSVEHVGPGDGAFGVGTTAAVKDDDVPQLRQAGVDLLHAGPQLRAGEQHLRAAVGQAVADGVGAEGGEEGADDGAELEGAEDGEVQLRHALQEDEDAVALPHAEPS